MKGSCYVTVMRVRMVIGGKGGWLALLYNVSCFMYGCVAGIHVTVNVFVFCV